MHGENTGFCWLITIKLGALGSLNELLKWDDNQVNIGELDVVELEYKVNTKELSMGHVNN